MYDVPECAFPLFSLHCIPVGTVTCCLLSLSTCILHEFADQFPPMSRIVAVRKKPSKIRREAVTSIKRSYKDEGISGLHTSRDARHTDLKETSDAGW